MLLLVLSPILVSPLAWIMKSTHLVYLSFQYLLLVRCIWALFLIRVLQAQRFPPWYWSSRLMFDEQHNKGFGEEVYLCHNSFTSLSLDVYNIFFLSKAFFFSNLKKEKHIFQQ